MRGKEPGHGGQKMLHQKNRLLVRGDTTRRLVEGKGLGAGEAGEGQQGLKGSEGRGGAGSGRGGPMRQGAADGPQAGDQARDLLRTVVMGNQKAKMGGIFAGLIGAEERAALPCKGN